MSKFSLVKGYVHHCLYSVNQHSLHAPFVYHFYTQIIRNDENKGIFKQIESFRQVYLQNHNSIEIQSPGARSQVSRKKYRKISSIARNSLSSSKFSRFLYRLVLAQKAQHIIELGSSLGINTLYLSAACPEAKIYTFEGCPETVQLARKLFDQWPIKNITLIEGNIDETLPNILSELQTVDIAYMDANHSFEPSIRYYHLLKSNAHQNSIIVLDDIYWSAEMNKAWLMLKSDPSVTLSIDLFDAGLLFFKPTITKQHHALTL